MFRNRAYGVAATRSAAPTDFFNRIDPKRTSTLFNPLLERGMQTATLARQVRQRCRRGLRVRDHVVIIESLAEGGVRGDLGIPDAKV